jgi:hypothetical protein
MLNFIFSCLAYEKDVSRKPYGNAILFMTNAAYFAGQESSEIWREICVPYPCRISCFRYISVISYIFFFISAFYFSYSHTSS